ncbi:MAG: hypothetical protein IJU72_01845, partial [Bacteroidales bacterium]|nr:hypothetical protein [Bacteroidales bacterium]
MQRSALPHSVMLRRLSLSKPRWGGMSGCWLRVAPEGRRNTAVGANPRYAVRGVRAPRWGIVAGARTVKARHGEE